jgi:hypothetical protein
MAYDEQAAERIRRILGRRTEFAERKMFGGVCFMVSGHMCCGLNQSALVVRVGREAYADALAQPHARPMDFTGRPLAGMVYVDPRGYETARALERWVERGLGFVESLPARRQPAGGPRRAGGSRSPRSRDRNRVR